MTNNLNRSAVALIRCESYDRENVRAAVAKGIGLLGGITSIFKKEQRVLLKPNVLSGKSPDQCVTTHPEVFYAVAELALQSGLKISYGDSPAIGKPSTVLDKSGISKVAKELDLIQADFENGEIVSFTDGIRNKQFKIAKGVLEAEGIISLPKLKTHGLTRLTGAVKNQFGCIPGFSKPEFHVKLPDAVSFSKMLVDLTRLINPNLFVMDAIESMEGNGPGSGDPVSTKFLMFSTDSVAMDTVAGKILNIKPDRVPTTVYGAEFGLGNMDDEKIDIIGDDLTQFIKQDFNIERGPQSGNSVPWKYRIAKNLISNKPVNDKKLCKQCGICIDQCPVVPKALKWKNDHKIAPPVYDYKKCIRCYCCQEVCPYKAIHIKVPMLRRAVDFLYP